MELNKKCLDILLYLKNENDYIRIETLANAYKLTERAIRYNLDKIEKFLLKNGFSYLDKQHNRGVRLVEDPKLFEFIDRFTSEYTPYKYVYSKEERFRFILTTLLQSNEPINISFFQKKLTISKNTVLKVIDEIEEYIADKELILVRKPRVGIYVEGREIDKRKILIELISETVSTEDIVSYIDNKVVNSKINNLQLETLFSEIDMDYLDSLIRGTEKELGKEFSDDGYSSIITHLAIMIKRIQLNKNLFIPPVNIQNIESSKEFNVAVKITKKLENKFKINIPMEETSYIALHFLGAKVIKSSNVYSDEDMEYGDIYSVSLKMTEEIEKIYNVCFKEDKEKVVEGLVVHLRPSIYRIKYNKVLINPLFNDIITKHRELFLNTKKVIKHFEEYLQSKVNDHETSYIALHFGAALESIKENITGKAKIVLVCGTGIGTANMIASQISKEFNVEVIDTVSSRNITSIDREAIDFIISTVDLLELSKDEYIKISPMMLKKDYDKLNKYLQIKYKGKDNDDSNLILANKLMDIVEKYCDIKDKQQLQYEFLYELIKREQQDVERSFVYMLNDLLTRDVIKLNVECENWIQAIKFGTNILEEKGTVGKSYCQAILRSFEELGPYMVVAPGIVLSHGRPEDGVNSISMSLVTLKEPVNFGSELNDPVKLIITLAALDNESHLKALAQLMELFMNNEDLKIILKATNKEEVINVLNKYSN